MKDTRELAEALADNVAIVHWEDIPMVSMQFVGKFLFETRTSIPENEIKRLIEQYKSMENVEQRLKVDFALDLLYQLFNAIGLDHFDVVEFLRSKEEQEAKKEEKTHATRLLGCSDSREESPRSSFDKKKKGYMI